MIRTFFSSVAGSNRNYWSILKIHVSIDLLLFPLKFGGLAGSVVWAVTIAGMVVVMALLASLQPAWKASRMDPVRALGHV